MCVHVLVHVHVYACVRVRVCTYVYVCVCVLLLYIIIIASEEGSTRAPSSGKAKASEEPNEFQRKRVDMLLSKLVKRYPPKAFKGKVSISSFLSQ